MLFQLSRASRAALAPVARGLKPQTRALHVDNVVGNVSGPLSRLQVRELQADSHSMALQNTPFSQSSVVADCSRRRLGHPANRSRSPSYADYQNKKSFTIIYTTSLAIGAFVIPTVAVGLQL